MRLCEAQSLQLAHRGLMNICADVATAKAGVGFYSACCARTTEAVAPQARPIGMGSYAAGGRLGTPATWMPAQQPRPQSGHLRCGRLAGLNGLSEAFEEGKLRSSKRLWVRTDRIGHKEALGSGCESNGSSIRGICGVSR